MKQTLSNKIRIIDSEASGWADDIKDNKVIPKKEIRKHLKKFIEKIEIGRWGGTEVIGIRDIKTIIKLEFGEELTTRLI